MRNRINLTAPGQIIDEAAVEDHSPLRPAGRTRSVDDIGEMIGRNRRRGIGDRGSGEEERMSIKNQDLGKGRQRGRGEQGGLDGRRSEENGEMGILEDKREAVDGGKRVDREIGTSRLEDSQQADQHLRRALETDTHQGIGADTEGDEEMSQLISLLIELTERKGKGIRDEGRRIWGEGGLKFKELVGTEMGREIERGVIPAKKEQIAFRGREQGKTRDRKGGIGAD